MGDQKGFWPKHGWLLGVLVLLSLAVGLLATLPAQAAADDSSTVAIHYLNTNGQPIAGQTAGQLSGEPTSQISAADWQSVQRNIKGYTFSHAETNGTTVAPETMTYGGLRAGLNLIYKQDTGTVSISYVDPNDRAIHNTATTAGELGTNYTTTPPTITGYTVKGIAAGSAPASGQYTAGTVNVKYVYTANQPAVETGKVVVKYLDIFSKSLHADTVISGPVGTGYQVSPLNIPGYSNPQIVAESISPAGTYQEGTLTVIYVYHRDGNPPEVEFTSIVAQYQDIYGHDLTEPILISGTEGSEYHTTQLSFPGYIFEGITSDSAAPSGRFPESWPLVITYVYKKSGQTSNQSTSSAGTEAAKIVQTVSQTKTPANTPTNTATGRLPQTDEMTGMTSVLLTILGVVLLGGSVILYRKVNSRD
jgi:hypothetical protein